MHVASVDGLRPELVTDTEYVPGYDAYPETLIVPDDDVVVDDHWVPPASDTYTLTTEPPGRPDPTTV